MRKALSVACAALAVGCGHASNAVRSCWSMPTTVAIGACLAVASAQQSAAPPTPQAPQPPQPPQPPAVDDQKDKQKQAEAEHRVREEKEKEAEQARADTDTRQRLAEFQRLQHDNAERAAHEAAQRAADKASGEKRARLVRRAKKKPVVQNPPPRLGAKTAIDRFTHDLAVEDGSLAFYIYSSRYAPEPNKDATNVLLVAVPETWSEKPKVVRLSLARKVWRIWANANHENAPDHDRSRLEILEVHGASLVRVGGSGFLGSSISVDD